MTLQLRRTACLSVGLCFLLLGINCPLSLGETAGVRFSAQDLSFLWPVPTTVEEVSRLISGDQTLADGKTEILPNGIFQQVLGNVQTVSITASSGDQVKVIIPSSLGFEKLSTWKIAGIRVDPSAPSCDAGGIQRFGSTPQVRIVIQPVTIAGTTVKVHDFTAHLAFDFVKSGAAISTSGQITPAVPDV